MTRPDGSPARDDPTQWRRFHACRLTKHQSSNRHFGRNGNGIATDYAVSADRIRLFGSGFFAPDNYGPTETLRDELFVRNADGLATRDGGPQLVQNGTTGVVYDDVDATGGTAAVTLIQVDPSVALSAPDFLHGTSFS
ncbi:MAG: hypothetical protein U1E14_04805 [Geminicoccaceae bacterium]